MKNIRMIADYRLRQILDSRGNPTVEAEIILDDMTHATASVPSGASTGEHEAVEKRDDVASRYLGKSVSGAIEFADSILGETLIGANALNQVEMDSLLIEVDGTPQKSKLGANITLAISLAVSRAAAASLGMPLWSYLGGVQSCRLPMPLLNVFNGGAHADNPLDIQEFMIVPIGAKSFSQALRMGTEVYHHLKHVLLHKGMATNVGDEGGFAPNLSSSREALDLIAEAVNKSEYTLGKDIAIALDVAASEVYKGGKYHIDGQIFDSAALVEFYEELCKEYPIVSIEDGAAEDDWDTWAALTAALGQKIQLVGDDVFVTNPRRIQQGILRKAANALLVKPNQVGTLTETLDAVRLAQRNRYNIVASHRSGETEDTFISDFAVAVGADQIKVGAPCRTDRVAKYNQLLRIEEALGETATFATGTFSMNVQDLLTI